MVVEKLKYIAKNPCKISILIEYYMISIMVCFFVQQQENGGGETQIPTENATSDSNAFTSFTDLLMVL
jgi:hypothetical protein